MASLLSNLPTLLYNTFIMPLYYIIELVFVMMYRMLGDPGLAIVGVSIAVNVIVLPLYQMADRLQQEERDRQQRMSHWVDHIKQHFKGDEQYMMLTTYYRQQGYKQWYALNSSFSLLLQIPVFISAYSFLSNLSILSGAPFLFIPNLGVEDQIIHVAGTNINFLPIAMTLLNCVSTFFYTRNLALRDKVQAYGLALVFLVLLYHSPSGLVLYWTCNQIFSLIKNILTKSLKNPNKALVIIVQLFVIAVFGYLYSRGRLTSAAHISVPLAIAAELLVFLAVRPRKEADQEKADGKLFGNQTSAFLFACLAMTALLGFAIPTALIGASPTEFFDVNGYENPLWHIAYTTCVFGGLFVIWFGVYYFLSKDRGRGYFALGTCMLAGIALCDYFFFGQNLGTVTNSLTFEINPTYPIEETLGNLAVIAAVCGAVLLIKKLRPQLLTPLFAIITIALIGVSVPSFNSIYSQIDTYRVEKEAARIAAEEEAQQAALEAEAQAEDSQAPTTASYTGAVPFDDEGNPLPIITLSRNGQNVVVLFLDRAISCYLPYILNEKPELASIYEGFVYYPNTISYGGITVYGGPPLAGGYEYVPVEMDKRDDELMVDKNDEANMVMPVLFSENGYHSTVCDPALFGYRYVTMDYSKFYEYDNIDVYHTEGAYTQQFAAEVAAISHENYARNFVFYSLFKASPVIAQPTVYDNGTYFTTLQNFALRAAFVDSYTVLANLQTLTQIEDEGNEFLFLHNHTPHETEYLQMPNYELSVFVDNSGYEDLSRFTLNGETIDMTSMFTYMEHYHANMASLLRVGEWLEWLKSEGVYDNTRIIIVSDHGYELEQLESLIVNDELNIEVFNPLFMVKDFDAHGELTTSDEFMTNADTPTIAFEGLIANPVNPFTGNAISSDYKNEHYQYVTTSWHHDAVNYHQGTTFDLEDGVYYSVHDDIFDHNNWQRVGDESMIPEDY